jgi:hypothetical protein
MDVSGRAVVEAGNFFYPERKSNSSGARPQPRLGSRRGRSIVRASQVFAIWKVAARWTGVVLVVLGVFLAAAPVAAAETVTTEEQVVLENGDSAVEVSELSGDAVTAMAGTAIKCKKVHGWRGLKHPLFGYFYWKYILTIRWCWRSGGSVIVRTTNPWSPTYWRDVECCMQFSGWDFKGHIGLDIDGGAGRSLYRVRTQGKFQQCYQFCFNTRTPWVRLTGYPRGAWGWGGGS